MRILFAILLAAGMTLVVVGAVVPGLFVLSLIGMLVITGTASVGLAAVMQHTDRRVHY